MTGATPYPMPLFKKQNLRTGRYDGALLQHEPGGIVNLGR